MPDPIKSAAIVTGSNVYVTLAFVRGAVPTDAVMAAFKRAMGITDVVYQGRATDHIGNWTDWGSNAEHPQWVRELALSKSFSVVLYRSTGGDFVDSAAFIESRHPRALFD
jgi:hypothetical protein